MIDKFKSSIDHPLISGTLNKNVYFERSNKSDQVHALTITNQDLKSKKLLN